MELSGNLIWFATSLSVINFIVAAVIGFLVWQNRSFINKLFPQTEDGDFRLKIEELLGMYQDITKFAGELAEHQNDIRHKNLANIQKFAMMRYNPYGDVGGDQSFSICLLNGDDNGVILSSLHSRAGTRIYAKSIKGGKSDTNLSSEESEVLVQSLKHETN